MGGKNKKGNVGNWEDYNRRENEWRQANSFPSSTWESPYKVVNPPPPPQYEIPYQSQEPQYYIPRRRPFKTFLRITGIVLLTLLFDGFLWFITLAVCIAANPNATILMGVLPMAVTVGTMYIVVEGTNDIPPLFSRRSDEAAFLIPTLILCLFQFLVCLAVLGASII